jgi:hypothetical protein
VGTEDGADDVGTEVGEFVADTAESASARRTNDLIILRYGDQVLL